MYTVHKSDAHQLRLFELARISSFLPIFSLEAERKVCKERNFFLEGFGCLV